MRAHYTVFSEASIAKPDCHETAVVDDDNSVSFQLHKPLYAVYSSCLNFCWVEHAHDISNSPLQMLITTTIVTK